MSSPSITYNTTFLGSTNLILTESCTLLRLAKGYDAICKASRYGEGEKADSQSRMRVLTAIDEIWKDALKEMTDSYGESLAQVKSKILSLKKNHGPDLPTYLTSVIASTTNLEELKQCIEVLQSDISSLSIFPVMKASAGFKGPTLLVNYPSVQNKTAYMNNYVIKWTNWNELTAQKVYSAFSTFFSTKETPDASCGFLVPKSTGLDLDNNIHQLSNHHLVQIPEEISLKLNHVFNEIAANQKAELSDENREIMLAERINGENILDFAVSKYPTMNPSQKEKFFQRLGRLSMLDILMGNLDRLVKSDLDRNDNYRLNTEDSNLGNVMVVWSDKYDYDPLLYAIDNEIDEELINDTSKREKYVLFLKSLFSKEKDALGTRGIAESMVRSICYTIESLQQEMSKEERQAKGESLKKFSSDVEKFACEFFDLGLQEMQAYLQKQLLVEWTTEKTKTLRKHIQEVYPPLLPAIEERFNAFLSIRNS